MTTLRIALLMGAIMPLVFLTEDIPTQAFLVGLQVASLFYMIIYDVTEK